METVMKVQNAEDGDICELVRMRIAYLREDHGSLSESDERVLRRDLPDYYRKHLNQDLFVYMVREGGTIVSCAFLLVTEKPMSPSFINGKTGTVLNVYTEPSARRKGYAGAVMKALLAEAERMELSAVEPQATEDGYPLYRSVGFTDDVSKYHRMKWKKK